MSRAKNPIRDEYALDNQPVLHLEDRLCREQEHSLQNEYALDNQPVLHLENRFVEGKIFIKSLICPGQSASPPFGG